MTGRESFDGQYDDDDTTDEQYDYMGTGEAPPVFGQSDEENERQYTILLDQIQTYQDRNVFCYIEEDNRAEEIQPNDSHTNVERALEEALAGDSSVTITHIWPEDVPVYRGIHYRSKPPTEFALFCGSTRLSTIHSLREIQVIADQSDDMHGLEIEMIQAVLDVQLRLQRFHFRTLILELLAQPDSDFHQIAEEFLDNLRDKQPALYASHFSTDDVTQAEGIRHEREAIQHFLTRVGVSPFSIQTLDQLHTAIRNQKISYALTIYVQYLDSLPLSTPENVVQDVIIPLCNWTHIPHASDHARKTLVRLGYSFHPQRNCWELVPDTNTTEK